LIGCIRLKLARPTKTAITSRFRRLDLGDDRPDSKGLTSVFIRYAATQPIIKNLAAYFFRYIVLL